MRVRPLLLLDFYTPSYNLTPRSQVVSVKDLKPHQAWHAARQIRLARTPHSHHSPSHSLPPSTPVTAPDATPTPDIYKHLVSLVGGRLSYLVQAALHGDMLAHAKQMLDTEREWLQSQIGLIQDCDDDVMDEVRLPPSFAERVLTAGGRTAKMELLLVAALARVREDAAGAGEGRAGEDRGGRAAPGCTA